MIRFRLILTGISLFGTLLVSAQSVSLRFPHFAGQEWYFTAFSGERQDTFATGVLDPEGQTVLRLPDNFKNYRGMTRWLLVKGGGLDIIIAGSENISVSCTEAVPSQENIIYENTAENTSQNEFYKRQQQILGKVDVMRMAVETYRDDDEAGLLSAFKKELEKQEEKYNSLQAEMTDSPLYAARFAQIVNLGRGLPQILSSDHKESEKQLKDFIVNALDMDALYTSGHWRGVIEQWTGWYVYDKENNLQYFVSDAQYLLDRTASDKVYAELAERIIASCEKQGWHDQEIELAFFLQNRDRIKNPAGKVKSLYTLLSVRKGSKAPVLQQGKLPKKKTILVFHESDCGNCKLQMAKLAGLYPELGKKGYEVVSISADTDKQTFEDTARYFPWKNKYCSLEGFAGKDFQNYGVIGTPCFYLIDGKGIIQGRYARVADMELE